MIHKTIQVDISCLRIMLIPVHVGVHWCLLLFLEEKTTEDYSSWKLLHPKVKHGIAIDNHTKK